MGNKLFITDFDGVLCDSVIECLLVSYNAYQRLTSPTFQRLLDLDVIALAKRENFRQLRAYLRGAEDFVPMIIATKEELSISSQKEFDTFLEEHKAQLPEYLEAFYAERDYLIHNEKELWLSLNQLFDGFTEEFQQRSSFENIYLLTTKRQEDVLELFDYLHIHFPADHIIYQKANGKPQRLLDMLQSHNAVIEGSAYFEDQVDFLVESQKHHIGSYLAGWGYVSEEQKQLARQHNIPIITPQTYKEILRTF